MLVMNKTRQVSIPRSDRSLNSKRESVLGIASEILSNAGVRKDCAYDRWIKRPTQLLNQGLVTALSTTNGIGSFASFSASSIDLSSAHSSAQLFRKHALAMGHPRTYSQRSVLHISHTQAYNGIAAKAVTVIMAVPHHLLLLPRSSDLCLCLYGCFR